MSVETSLDLVLEGGWKVCLCVRDSLRDSQRHRGGAVIEMGVSFIRSHRVNNSVV